VACWKKVTVYCYSCIKYWTTAMRLFLFSWQSELNLHWIKRSKMPPCPRCRLELRPFSLWNCQLLKLLLTFTYKGIFYCKCTAWWVDLTDEIMKFAFIAPPGSKRTRLSCTSCNLYSLSVDVMWRSFNLVPLVWLCIDLRSAGGVITDSSAAGVDEAERQFNLWTHRIHDFFVLQFLPSARLLLAIRQRLKSAELAGRMTQDPCSQLATELTQPES